jgi:hypothetical protein
MAISEAEVRDSMIVGTAPATTGFRVTWSSVWTGFLIAVGAFLLMTVLGMAIGISTADVAPGQEGNARTLGLGAVAWSGITLLIALFIGGMVATRTGTIYDKAVGITEGMLVWVLAMLALIYMASSGIAMLSSGVFGFLGGAAQGATSVMRGVDVSQLSRGDVDEVVTRLRDPGTVRVVAAATGTSEQEARGSLEGIAQRVEAARNDPAQAAAEARAGLEELSAQAAAHLERVAAEAQPYAVTTLWSTLAAMVVALLAAIAGAMTGRAQAARRLHASATVVGSGRGAR